MRKFRVRVNGHTYEVEIEELTSSQPSGLPVPEVRRPRQREQVPPTGSAPEPQAVSGPTEISAPLPGLIVEVLVKQGQQVAEDDVVVVLEAMKMENELTAPKSGTVREVLVEPGETVDQGKRLVVLE